MHRDPVERQDDIATEQKGAAADGNLDMPAAQPRVFSRAAWFDHFDEEAVHQRNLQKLAQFGAHELHVKADPRADDVALFNQTGKYSFRQVDRYREADVFSVGQDGGIDAYDFTAAIEQRAPGVARIDWGIGLDEGLGQ